MSDIVWGDPIEVNGVRPDWLKDGDRVDWCWKQDRWEAAFDQSNYPTGTTADRLGWENGVHSIRLPASHPYYTVQRYNAEHGTSFVYWPGGDNAPDDWDGGGILNGDGEAYNGFHGYDWCYRGATKIIGYTRRTEPQPEVDDGDYVLVRRMTEEEFGTEMWHRLSGQSMLIYLGIIKPEPTEAERIAAKTGLTPEQVQAVLDAQSV